MRRSSIRHLALFHALFALSCEATPEATADSARSRAGAASAAKPELVTIGADVKSGRDFVRSEIERAKKDGKKLVIYVGATWCEPCQYFHKAVEEGRLDRDLPNVRFLDFDHDQHEQLLADGDMDCRSRLIPLFARPNDDGTCGDKRAEGGIKGEGAVAHILPKLKKIL